MSGQFLSTWCADLFNRERRSKSALVCDDCKRLIPSRKVVRRGFSSGFSQPDPVTVWACESCEKKAAKYRLEYALALRKTTERERKIREQARKEWKAADEKPKRPMGWRS